MTTATVEPSTKVRTQRRAAVPLAATPVENATHSSHVKIGSLNINLSPSSHMSEMKTEIVTITPQLATEMLERSQDNGALNRAIKQKRIERYAADMRDGNWRLTGESIKLDKLGNVRDGQHRLFACVEAAVPFSTMVTINVPDDAFDVMDSGAPRTPGDMMYVHRYENPRQIAAAVRYTLIWNKYGKPDNAQYVSKAEILKWVERNKAFIDFVAAGRKIQKAGVPGGDAIWTASLWQLANVDPEETNKFAEAIASGAGLAAGSGALVLRNRLIGAKARGEKLTVTEVAALIVKGWNYWRDGETIRALGWRQGGSSPEGFPKPR